ncbi:MAG: hypothetical protein GX493_08730 [Firmicutes bacterium]|nr:hypothetical protein [Bacillota bacterium]
MNNVAAISQESMARAESVSAVAEEQSSSTQRVASLAGELHRIAEGLEGSHLRLQTGRLGPNQMRIPILRPSKET